MEPGTGGKMFTCERCGVNSADGFIMPDGTRFCTPCAMPTDNVDQNSLSAVAQAKTVQEKIDAWRNCNGVQQSSKSNDSGESRGSGNSRSILRRIIRRFASGLVTSHSTSHLRISKASTPDPKKLRSMRTAAAWRSKHCSWSSQRQRGHQKKGI